MPAIVEPAPAKLNLDLRVAGRRADGYHLLDSLVTFLAPGPDQGDRLTFAPADALRLEVVGPMAADLPQGEENIVLRAAQALADLLERAPAAAITLDKRLPVAAGIGGGSADAAATLRGLCRLWRAAPAAEALARLALELGADVPVCLAGRPARMQGIGERLEPWPLPTLDLVLINPRRPLATAAVFRALDLARCGPRALEPVAADAWRHSRNDLEPAARLLLPAIDAALAALAAVPGCQLARMSGSGPTCFGLFADRAAATAAAAALRAAQPGWWVVAGRTLAGA